MEIRFDGEGAKIYCKWSEAMGLKDSIFKICGFWFTVIVPTSEADQESPFLLA